MKKLLIYFIPLLIMLNGCSSNLYEGQWKTIEVGEYVFDFPQGFKLVKEQTEDSYSYVGRVEDDEMSFNFSFDFYSTGLSEIPSQYLKTGDWKYNFLIFHEFQKYNAAIKWGDILRVEVLNIRLATEQDKKLLKCTDYVAKCKLDSLVIDYAFCLPHEIRNVNFIIDTIDNCYRKIVYSKIPEEEYTGIFIKRLKGISALMMTTSKINSQQQKIALRILKSVRLKNGKQ